MKGDVARLERWIQAYAGSRMPMRRTLLAGADPHTLNFAERLGLLTVIGIETELGCEYCEPPHLCKITLGSKSRYRYRCPINGWVDVARRDLELLAFDPQVFLNLLAKAIRIKNKRMASYADGRLTQIGLVPHSPKETRGWVLGYAEGLEDANVLTAVIEALETRFPRGPGLIATPSKVPINSPLPRGYRLIALSDFSTCRTK